MMFDKRNNALSPWRSVATIGSIAILLAACTDYSQKFEEEYEFGPGADRASGLDDYTLTDFRDNFTYSVRKVGNLLWMMDDLAHPYFTDDAYKGTYCYKDKEGVCDEIGRLYPGEYLEYACPKGWRLPSVKEWSAFFNSNAFREYTPRCNGASDLYKGYVDGEHTLNGYGEDAYYWTNSNSLSDSYIDCVHFKRDYSSSGELKPDYSSLSTAELCHEQWKLAVRCVKDADSELTTSSSSESRVSSSLRANIDAPYPCGDLWCGWNDTTGNVNTGFNDREFKYWYTLTDENDEGTSTFIFPSDDNRNNYEYFYSSLVKEYGGIKGAIELGEGCEYPYLLLGFDLYDATLRGVDISDWGGLCLVFESTIGFGIELVPENDATVTEYNNYKATILTSASYLSSTPVSVDLPWNKFKQQIGWGKSVDQATILSNVATIRLKFTGTAGTYGEFNIRSIGRLGSCN